MKSELWSYFSDFKIHKWGEPTRTELFQGLMGEQGINYAEVREDNILEVACCREVEQENCFDEKFADKIRSPDMIVVEVTLINTYSNYRICSFTTYTYATCVIQVIRISSVYKGI